MFAVEGPSEYKIYKYKGQVLSMNVKALLLIYVYCMSNMTL